VSSPTSYPYTDFVVNKYRVVDKITLWLLIHGGDPPPVDASARTIREQVTPQLIKKLASTLSDTSVRETVQTAIAPSGQRGHSGDRLAGWAEETSGAESAPLDAFPSLRLRTRFRRIITVMIRPWLVFLENAWTAYLWSKTLNKAAVDGSGYRE
jgi:hypothetical protein